MGSEMCIRDRVIISFIIFRVVVTVIENMRESRDWKGPKAVILLR